MVRMAVIAMCMWSVSTLASAQTAPPPPPPPPPDILGDLDRASGDPETRMRKRETIERQRDELRPKSTPAQLGKARPAKADEVQTGKPVNDSRGLAIALVEKVEPDGVVLNNGTSSIKVPLDAFGVNKKGLLLAVTKQEFDQLVASAIVQPKS